MKKRPSVIGTLTGCIQEFKRDTILTPIFVIFEVAFDVLIPMVMAMLIDRGIETGDMHNILFYGAILLVMGRGRPVLSAPSAAATPPGRPRALPATCAGKCIKMCRIFLFQHR